MFNMSVCLASDSYSLSQLATATLGLSIVDSASMFVTRVEARRPAHTRLNSDSARSDTEQARGMAQATITGLAGPIVVPQQPQSLTSQQSDPSEAPSAPGSGEAAAAPVPEAAEKDLVRVRKE